MATLFFFPFSLIYQHQFDRSKEDARWVASLLNVRVLIDYEKRGSNLICQPKCCQSPFRNPSFAQISLPFPLLLWFPVSVIQTSVTQIPCSQWKKQGKSQFPIFPFRSLKWIHSGQELISLTNLLWTRINRGWWIHTGQGLVGLTNLL